MLVVLYSLIAALVTGFHIFSLKYLHHVEKKWHYYALLIVILLAILSRYLIFHSMKHTTNPTIVHLLLNFSIFVTFFLSLWFLKLNDFNIYLFSFGLLLTVIGFFLIQYSYDFKLT
jgi:drug/metabolite transporter (DMT)-like permease